MTHISRPSIALIASPISPASPFSCFDLSYLEFFDALFHLLSKHSPCPLFIPYLFPLICAPVCYPPTSLWHTMPSRYALASLCTRYMTRFVQPHPPIPETDLLLLSTQSGHTHFVQFDPIPLGTGDWSKLGKSNLSLGLTKKRQLLWGQKM